MSVRLIKPPSFSRRKSSTFPKSAFPGFTSPRNRGSAESEIEIPDVREVLKLASELSRHLSSEVEKEATLIEIVEPLARRKF
jgi:hypothetical protein